MKTCLLISAVAFATASLTAVAESTSPWLPIPGQLTLTINHTAQSGDSAYIGKTEIPVIDITGGEASDYDRNTTSLILNYGISDALAIDAVIGYGDVDAGVSESDSDISDAIIGVSWRIVDEYIGALPTITARVGVIIAGDYEVDQVSSIGSGENGIDVSLLVGKQLTNSISVSAEIGHQNRNGEVPDASYYGVNANYSFLEKWGVNIGYSVKEHGGDLDIGGEGFSPARFPEIRAEVSLAKVGLNYSIASNQGIALNFAKTVDGRNVVKDDTIIGASYTYAF